MAKPTVRAIGLGMHRGLSGIRVVEIWLEWGYPSQVRFPIVVGQGPGFERSATERDVQRVKQIADLDLSLFTRQGNYAYLIDEQGVT